jgi:hypothetical protein
MTSYPLTLAFASVFLVAFAHAAELPATVIVKNGSCPSGYSTSGAYCLSSK